jgi:hypothetical protein
VKTTTVYEVWDLLNDRIILLTEDLEEALRASEQHNEDGGHGAIVEYNDGVSRLVSMW